MENTYWIIAAPCIAILMDVVTGFCAHSYLGDVDSSKLRYGLYSKLGEVCAIVLSFFTEWAFTVFSPAVLQIHVNVPIGVTVCGYILLTELVSITENIGCLSPGLGNKLVDVFGIEPRKVNLEEVPEDADTTDTTDSE